MCSIHPQAKENFSHGVCCGGVPRARPKPARWGDVHPGTVASEPSREHIIGMRMAMMPTSRCCPSPPSPLQPCNCKSNALKSQRRALAPFDFLARSLHSAPCRKPRLHPTYTPRPAIRRARRLQKCKATPPQKSPPAKVQGDAARPSDVPAAAKDALLGSMSAGRVGTKTKHALTHETSTPESIAFLSLPDGGVSNVRLAKPSISASFPDC